ncbi:MAG: cytochrome c class [Flavipsychrobacter sp.]|jgi:cytochrome c551/c552|nr:cytochrome c class [Flavipsychrobacter sp.]
MKRALFLATIWAMIASCGNDKQEENPYVMQGGSPEAQAAANENPAYDPERGEGKFTNVEVSPKLDAAMADKGQKVYEVKCNSCHKLTDEKLVGPGWKGVTTRRKPEWIMNFVTNTDKMLDKDPAAQAQLEICLVRMPNQNLSDDDARSLYEFMRKNDGIK